MLHDNTCVYEGRNNTNQGLPVMCRSASFF